MFAHSGPMRDPLLEKIGPEQINRTLEIRAKQEEHTHQIRIIQQKSYDTFVSKSFVLLGFLALVVCGLCWLFLHYGKTDQVFNLIALIFAGGGGVGIGIGLKGRGRPELLKSADEQDFPPP